LSKESRRRQRTAGQQPATASSGAATRRPASGSGGSSTRHPSTSPEGTPRAGRRERVRAAPRRSFIERYRVWLIGGVVVAVIAVVGAGVFAAATKPAFACSTEWQPDPTASPAADASPQPGYVQPDMGHTHVAPGTVIRYTYCPPASGRHYIGTDIGPIPARAYGPNDTVIPEGWVHNLEHGGLVILYRGADADQTALRAVYDAIPASPVCGFPPGGNSPSPVVARFDQMAWPFAALVWDRVLPLETLDQAAILDFYARYGETTNPEKLCQPSASPSASPAASGSTEPSPSPSENASPSEVASPSSAPAASPS
jgi:Protein of unknown function (DUF3105)